MEITFSNQKLKKLCEQKAVAQKQLGQDCARKLQSRLADLMAAESVRDLTAGRPHPLKGDRLGEFAIDLVGAKRLVFSPINEPVPRKQDGSIDWLAVTQICIVFIGDYHG
ncbi:MAG: killer suppression protein HigA [Phormidium sp. GEM2.Bin31]|nr:MAG: killer suppression protein HigA [Phormidium sp. GEM2.Bin31]